MAFLAQKMPKSVEKKKVPNTKSCSTVIKKKLLPLSQMRAKKDFDIEMPKHCLFRQLLTILLQFFAYLRLIFDKS
jgi:hypothetical protein